MNTSQLNRVNNLLNVGIPKKNQEMRAHLENVVYIEPRHIMMARTTDVSDPEEELVYQHFDGPEKKEFSGNPLRDPLRYVREHNKRTVVNRKFLLDILQAMDSDLVIVYADEECPIGIVGMMARELMIEGVVAPRICDYIPKNPEGFYD